MYSILPLRTDPPPPPGPNLWMNPRLCTTEGANERNGCRIGTEPVPCINDDRKRVARALARPRPLPGRLRPRRRLEPAARSTRQRRDPVHQGARDRPIVFAVARFAVH